MMMTKKKLKQLKNEMYTIGGAGIAVGTTGLIVGTTALVKEIKLEKRYNKEVPELEKHVASSETSLTKACSALVTIQDTLCEHGLMRKK